VDRGTSATRLEGWAKCPHAYFQQYLLRVAQVELPEQLLQISALDRGNLVHQVLEEFVQGELSSGSVPEPDEPWSPEAHDRLDAIAAARADDYERRGLTGHALFWQRDRRRLEADLHTVLREDDARRRRTGSRPRAAELPFGIDGAEPVRFPLGDGRAVVVRGKADRVDQGDDGTLHVVDYKTGKTDPYKGLSAADPHQGGRHLQLAVYAEAARQRYGGPETPVVATYWFTSARGRFEELGYPVTPEVAAEVGSAMRTIVEGIETGLFPPHPLPKETSPFTDCIWCDPDELGTTEAVARWEHKLADPRLAPYLALVAPPEPDLAPHAETSS
jgi:RecB family exonuclease